MKRIRAFSFSHRFLNPIPALLGLAVASGGMAAEVATPASPPPADPLAQAIVAAQDPSSAIQAYATAAATEPSNVAVEDAYLHRMVDFGLPEMADAQATDLTQRDPQDGVAWAVAGYMNAKRGQMPAAVADMQSAVRLAPTDPFVVRTASQMMAWYDLRADKAQLPAQTQASFEALGRQLAGNPGYGDAYAAAAGQIQQGAAAAAPAESAPATAWAAPQAVAPLVAPTVAPDYLYYPTYAPFADSYYYSQPPYWDNSYWWPTYGTVIIGGDDFGFGRHDGDYDRDDHRDRDRGGDRGGAWAGQGGNWTNRDARGTTVPSGRSQVGVRAPRSSFSFRPSTATPYVTRAPAVSAPRISTPHMSTPALNLGGGGLNRGGSLNRGGGLHIGGAGGGGGGTHGGGSIGGGGGGGGGGGRHR